MKLILGTAEFGPKAYGTAKEPLTVAEIEKILRLARMGGIKILEGAESYGCDDILKNSYFDVIYKVKHPYNLNRILSSLERQRLTGLLYHHTFDSPAQMPLASNLVDYVGSSVYNYKQVLGREGILEVPLNLEDKTFEKISAPVKLVRSVFGRGELLTKYSVKECLDYVRNNPTVHGIIVGVNSSRELEQILESWNS
jgi:hypothetical protein